MQRFKTLFGVNFLITSFTRSFGSALIKAIALPPKPPPTIRARSAPDKSAASAATSSSGRETV